jgi:hypothetical protein
MPVPRAPRMRTARVGGYGPFRFGPADEGDCGEDEGCCGNELAGSHAENAEVFLHEELTDADVADAEGGCGAEAG